MSLIQDSKSKSGESFNFIEKSDNRDTIICPDGGEVSLDWANDKISKNLPKDAPIIGILHTITGSARQNVGFMRYAASRGWRLE